MEVLYLLSYIGPMTDAVRKKCINGAAEETRTLNLRDGNAMLYQLSYCRLVGETGLEPVTPCL